MPRWKTTEQILNVSKDGEFFDENWMNYDSLYQYIPPNPIWKENREIKFEDVSIWEVICEWSGLSGVYASWCPYAHYFIVLENWKIIHEFRGKKGEKMLQKYLKEKKISFSLNKIWIDNNDLTSYIGKE